MRHILQRSSLSSIAFVILLNVLGCGGDGGQQASGDGGAQYQPEVQVFSQFESYLSEVKRGQHSAHQVVFIGMDGATWQFINPLIEQGALPNLNRIKQEGSHGTLLSTECFVSPPAWTAMNTGRSPENSGIYTFGKWSREKQEFKIVTTVDVTSPAVWDIASSAGRRVSVTNVPLTHPVRPVNGIMAAGSMVPVFVENPMALARAFTHQDTRLEDVVPPELRSYSTPRKMVSADALNTLVWWRVDTTNDNIVNYDRVALKIYPKTGEDTRDRDGLYVFNIGEYSPWLHVKVERKGSVLDAWCKLMISKRPDGRFEASLSQTLFDVRESAAQYTYPESLADELMSQFGYYLPSNFLKREFVPHVAEESAKYAHFFYDYDDWDLFYYVFTRTDNIHHLEGFSPRAQAVYQTIDRFLGELMAKLPDESTLIVASDHGFGRFEYGLDLNRFFENLGMLERKPDGEAIDFDRTMVFHNMWHLYFNHDLVTRENLERLGVQVGPTQGLVDAFAAHLQSAARKLTWGSNVFPVEFETISGTFAGDDPDMVVQGTYDNYVVEFWNIRKSRAEIVWRLAPSEAHNHEREGVFMMWGKHVRKGYDAGTRAIEDIAPTVLYLLDLPIAENLDGRPMYQVLQPGLVAAKTSYAVPTYPDVSWEALAPGDDTESLEERLRSLGYVR